MKVVLLIMFTFVTTSAFSQYPAYDTTKGIVVYYDDSLTVRADSAILIRKADKTTCQAFNIIDCGIQLGHRCENNWYEWRIIKLRDRFAIPVKTKISFHPKSTQ